MIMYRQRWAMNLLQKRAVIDTARQISTCIAGNYLNLRIM